MTDRRLILGDCVEVMRSLEENSVDAIVTDPPYGLGFMGKEWDHTDYHFHRAWGEQALRVLKPGGHLLAFGGTRTYHRMACALADAGFEIRDQLQWLYGSGFPKSLDVSKALDKMAGAEREVVRVPTRQGNAEREGKGVQGATYGDGHGGFTTLSEPVTDAARQWDGWGTALKPAHEPIVLARKPLSEPNVAANVLRWGTGALNVDGCRIGTDGPPSNRWTDGAKPFGGGAGHPYETTARTLGRWPANILLDEDAAEMLDGQSGILTSGKMMPTHTTAGLDGRNAYGKDAKGGFATMETYGDSGGASRFFYVAKASKRERGEGNDHPTVKPVELIRYLCRLVTPPGGLVLDPFVGSGTTGIAALKEGFQFVGIEKEEEYLEIARERIGNAFGLFASIPRQVGNN